MEDFDKKIKFWKRFSVILGLISFFGYIITLVATNIMAHGMQYGWVIFMVVGRVVQRAMFVLCVLSIIAIARVIILSSHRKQHLAKDYIMVVLGFALIFSPFAISEVLSYFRISWNDDDNVSITIKSKDPFYLSGDVSNSSSCDRRSGRLMPDEYKAIYGAENSDEMMNMKAYVSLIGEEILCPIAEFYKENGRYPNDVELQSLAAKVESEDMRSGLYNLRLEVGNEPNETDFTVLFDKNCTNQTPRPGQISVLSPLYGEQGRYCVYNELDDILENLEKH